MSLINKMLQDLDARGSTGAQALEVDVKPVAREERRVRLPLVLGLLGGAVTIGLAANFGWRYMNQAPGLKALAPTPATVVMTPAQVQPAAQAVVTAPLESNPPAPATQAEAAPAPQVRAGEPAAAADEKFGESKTQPAPSGKAQDPVVRKAPAARIAGTHDARAARPDPVAALAEPGVTAVGARQDNGMRRGEDAYRRALARLEDGRISEAVVALEQALQADPRHDAARQTLVGLLVENGRVDEAMQQLQQALAADPRQPALAMLLARLQIERGGSGIETLTHTLPHAGNDSEYHAFLAGALQRQERHREASEQYQAALRAAPQNGVWWMGLGISLQADKRDVDARAAFERARASPALSPELQAFVQRKLQQLSR